MNIYLCDSIWHVDTMTHSELCTYEVLLEFAVLADLIRYRSLSLTETKLHTSMTLNNHKNRQVYIRVHNLIIHIILFTVCL